MSITAKNVALIGPLPDAGFSDDGCSGGAPDYMLGVPIRRACNIHDWEYHLCRIHDQVLEGTWLRVAKEGGIEYVRAPNGLNSRIRRAKAELSRLREDLISGPQVQQKKLELFTYKEARRRFKELRKRDRRIADRQLRENIRRMAEADYLAGKIKSWQRAILWAAGGRYLGATKRWGWKAVQGPGHEANYVDLKVKTQARLQELDEEWRQGYEKV